MAMKIEHKCTRCNRTTSTEMQNVAAATAAEEVEVRRAAALKEIQEYLATVPADLLPDLLVVRRGHDTLVQTYLCNDEDAKRSCVERVDFVVKECATFDPRKPKARKAPAEAAAAAPANAAAAAPADAASDVPADAAGDAPASPPAPTDKGSKKNKNS